MQVPLMMLIETAEAMLGFTQARVSGGQTIGFVPTMGALHQGHAALVRRSVAQCDVTVVSVFVNPTQFNDAADLDRYPRTFESDKALLEQLNVDVMFFPSVEEMYPDGRNFRSSFELDGLDELMEGPNRPGHFNGVVQVVLRLFELVNPDRAYFGEKDFQQLAIIQHMVRKLALPIDVVGCETVREPDGLAMSSRNVRLSSNGRRIAPLIHGTLIQLRSDMAKVGLIDARQRAVARIQSEPALELEYLELVDSKTLQPATDQSEHIQACIAAWLDEVRLIDNLRVK